MPLPFMSTGPNVATAIKPPRSRTMDEKTILWAASLQAAATLIAGGSAGNPGESGWPEEQVINIAKRLYQAS